MPHSVVFMFSGQGSQSFQMGAELFYKNPDFRRALLELDEIAASITGRSVVQRIYDQHKSKSDIFDTTIESSLAIVIVEYALARVLLKYGIEPHCLLGASLGEVTSAMVGGLLECSTALEDACQLLADFETRCRPGAMVGILHSPDLFNNAPVLQQWCEIAALNFDSHFVVSCAREHLGLVEEYLRQEKITYQVLPVTVGFHSRLLEPAAPLAARAERNEAAPPLAPRLPILSCTGTELSSLTIGTYYWNIFRKPILFQKAIDRLESRGSNIYIDLGPAGTFAGFVRYILKGRSISEYYPILTPFGRDLKCLDTVLARFGL